MPKTANQIKRDESFNRLDTILRSATERGPVEIVIRFTDQSTTIGHLHHLDKYTILFVADSGSVRMIHKHAIAWMEIVNPIDAGLAELAADKSLKK